MKKWWENQENQGIASKVSKNLGKTKKTQKSKVLKVLRFDSESEKVRNLGFTITFLYFLVKTKKTIDKTKLSQI